MQVRMKIGITRHFRASLQLFLILSYEILANIAVLIPTIEFKFHSWLTPKIWYPIWKTDIRDKKKHKCFDSKIITQRSPTFLNVGSSNILKKPDGKKEFDIRRECKGKEKNGHEFVQFLHKVNISSIDGSNTNPSNQLSTGSLWVNT